MLCLGAVGDVTNELARQLCGEKIGFVLSRATTVEIPCALFSGDVELSIREEELVVVRDVHLKKGVPLILGVLRKLRRLEPFLRPEQRVPIIEFPKFLHSVETIPYSNVVVIPIAEISVVDNNVRLRSVIRYVPFPKSPVYRLRSGKALQSLLGQLLGGVEHLVVGTHIFTRDLEIPLNPKYLKYHVGVFGATGTGKSRLVMGLSYEIVRKTPYSVIIFDHTGLDYAHERFGLASACILRSTRIIATPDALIDWFIRKLRISSAQISQYIEATVFRWCRYLDQASRVSMTFSSQSEAMQRIKQLFENLTSGELDDQVLLDFIATVLNALSQYPILFNDSEVCGYVKEIFSKLLSETAENMGARYAQMTLGRRLEAFTSGEILANILFRKLNPREIIKYAYTAKQKYSAPIVIDLSYDMDIATKRSIVASIIDAAWEYVFETRKEVNIIFVIDEAQNYASRDAGYCKDSIESVAREGRKWGLGLIIASQRLVGSIDPNIRSNLNTVFFSKLSQTSDIDEVGKFADVTGISKSALAQLDEREFFVAGLMNPLRKALALHIREVTGWQ